ncbi:ROK family protein, partial [Myxococcus vastator]|uniref:ROK family protein n=1 Tax=Myxococcus vastator TaxID=2709664 RepID=UPI0013D1D366
MREANAVGSRRKTAERDARECWGGVDLGGTKIEAVVVDRAGAVLGTLRQPTPADGEPGDVVRAIHDTLEGAAHAAGLTSRQLLGVGVGAPGAVNANEGTLGHVSNVGRGWKTPY